MAQLKTHVGPGGRVVIPAQMRRALSIEVGDEVVLSIEDGAISVMKPEEAVKHAQRVVRRYISEERKLSEELIADRRRDAARGR